LLAEGHSISKERRVLSIDKADGRRALKKVVHNFRNGEHLREVWSIEDWRLSAKSLRMRLGLF
jgi:hypothetical protein